MREQGFIKLHRSIVDWRWYKDANTFRVFFHLILNANFKDGEYQKVDIKRGQVITGRKALAYELSMSEQNVRTALEHLKSTNEITIKRYPKFSIITIKNYDKYQSLTNRLTDKLTTSQPTANQHSTNNQPQYNNKKKDKKNKKGINNHFVSDEKRDDYIAIFESKSLFTD